MKSKTSGGRKSPRAMRISMLVCVGSLWAATAWGEATHATPSAEEIVDNVVNSDPWGLGGAKVTAKAVLRDAKGHTRTLEFRARSRRHDPPNSKSMVRFTAPPDLAGAAFLQVQNEKEDDDRFLFLPELKRSRRVSGSMRGTSFMGTDFSFADLDRRDFRECTSRFVGRRKVATLDCLAVEVTPSRADSPYGRIEMCVSPQNWLPLEMLMYDKANVLAKKYEALEIRRVSGSWFITRSRMHDEQRSHDTELTLEQIEVDADIADDEFTVRELEKL